MPPFDAKWSQIEESFYEALGDDQVVSRYSKFIEEGAASFGGTPMEQTISDISNHVSKCFGRDSSTAQWRLGITYYRIFEFAKDLPIDFKLIRNHILQTCGDELNKINEAKTIKKYLEDLKENFKTKSLLHEYTRNIPQWQEKNSTRIRLRLTARRSRSTQNGKK